MKNRPVSERRLLGIAGLGWLFDAMDVGILSFIIAALHAEWKLTPQEMSLDRQRQLNRHGCRGICLWPFG